MSSHNLIRFAELCFSLDYILVIYYLLFHFFILKSCSHFEAVEARFLRASFSAFMDILTLATKTIEEFGPGMEL